MCDNSYTEIVEDTIGGFDIYIGPNPDQYNEGYLWSVSENNEELDSGLVFTVDDGLEEIHKFINTSSLSYTRNIIKDLGSEKSSTLNNEKLAE